MLQALLCSMAGLLMAFDLLGVIVKLHSFNLSKDAYFHLTSVLNVITGHLLSSREKRLLLSINTYALLKKNYLNL